MSVAAALAVLERAAEERGEGLESFCRRVVATVRGGGGVGAAGGRVGGVEGVAAGSPPYLSIEAAAERWGLGYNAVYRGVRSGRIRAIKVGGAWRIPAGVIATGGKAVASC